MESSGTTTSDLDSTGRRAGRGRAAWRGRSQAAPNLPPASNVARNLSQGMCTCDSNDTPAAIAPPA
eukprot:5643736-Pyramimonas_sp.AAC.1